MTPAVVDALITLDPDTALSLETPGLVVSALGQLPDAKSAASGDLDALILRVSLLRAAGRFALATEAAALLSDAARRSGELSDEMACEAWYQVGMTSFAMGRLRDARVMLGQSERIAPPALRMRARGAIAVVDLLEGDVRGAQQVVAPDRDDNWRGSPWGEGLHLAEAWLRLEAGGAPGARGLPGSVAPHAGGRPPWAVSPSAPAPSCPLAGCGSLPPVVLSALSFLSV